MIPSLFAFIVAAIVVTLLVLLWLSTEKSSVWTRLRDRFRPRWWWALAPGLFILVSCATVPTSVPVVTGQSLIDAEATLDTALIAATVAVQSGLTTKAQNGEIATLTAPCPTGVTITLAIAKTSCPVSGVLALARQAQAASDTGSFAVLYANLLALAAQLAETH